MNRLTIRSEVGERRVSMLSLGVSRAEAVERLAQYEDSGLTPQEVMGFASIFKEALNAAYKELERELICGKGHVKGVCGGLTEAARVMKEE